VLEVLDAPPVPLELVEVVEVATLPPVPVEHSATPQG
jgi:hypothetical protein